MEDIIGILIPMLLSGAGLSDIMAVISGRGAGATSSDGLSYMLRNQMIMARREVPLVQSQRTLYGAASSAVSALGINPHTGFGQGLSSMLGNLYHIAPDMVGSIIGMPNGGQFFSSIANGASGIGIASGFGQSDIFNPYSVMSNHRRAMDLARRMYGMGTREGGGYDVSFSHGLNMNEMGMTAQRLLSSNLAYVDEETGKRINPFGGNKEESEKFDRNLKKLGSKFNEAASSLAKITGSVEEAINMMDRLAGGNFLGGTAAQARSVAERAMKMATAIRITSAISGMSPQDAYANMQSMQQAMTSGIGMSQYFANASGYSAVMQDMAYTGTMAFNTWAAMNPNATPVQKEQALLAANGRATAYATNNTASFSAAIADNANLFTEDQLKRFESALRNGHPESIFEEVQRTIGSNTLRAYMTDIGTQVAARKRIASDEMKSGVVRNLDRAGIEGNVQQAADFGVELALDRAMSDIDSDLSDLSGKGGLGNSVDNAVRKALVDEAEKGGMERSYAETLNVEELSDFVRGRPDMGDGRFDRLVNRAKIGAIKDRIKENTMSDKEEKEAASRLRLAIEGSKSVSKSMKDELNKMLDDGTDAATVMSELVKRSPKEAASILKNVRGGKLFRSEASKEMGRIEDIEKSQAEFTSEERLDAIEDDMKRRSIENSGALKSVMANDGFGGLSDISKLLRFSNDAVAYEKQGKVKLGGDGDLSKTYEEASKRMVAGLFGGQLGDLEGKALEGVTDKVSKRMLQEVRGGKSFQEAFRIAIGTLSDEEKSKAGDSLKRLKEGDFGRTLNGTSFVDIAAGVLGERYGNNGADSLKGLVAQYGKDISSLGDKEAMEQFANKAKEYEGKGIVSLGGDGDLSKTYEEASKRMVAGLFGGQLGDLEGKALEGVTDKVSKRMLQEVRGGKSFQEAFRIAMDKALTEEEKGKIGDEQMKQFLNEPVDSSKIGRNTFFAYTESVIDKMTDKDRENAFGEMRKLASGDFGDMNDEKAVGRFAEMAVKSGAMTGSERDLENFRNQSSEMLRGGMKGKDVINAMLKGMRSTGKRDLSFYTTLAAGTADQAALNSVAGMVDMRQLETNPLMASLQGYLDMADANRTMNRITNAIGGGDEKFTGAVIERTKNQLLELGDALKKGGVTKDVATLAFSGEGEENKKALNQVRSAIGDRKDADEYLSLVKTLALKDKKIGASAGIDVITGGKDAVENALNSKNAGSDVLDIARTSSREDSGWYKLLDTIGDFTKKISPFVTNPASFFDDSHPISVKVKEGSVKLSGIHW